MTREELEALAGRYQAKADRTLQNYQETGTQRYYREYQNNSDLSDALTMAANAREDHVKLLSLRSDLSRLAFKAQQGENVTESLLSVAILYGLIDRRDISHEQTEEENTTAGS